jgi:Bacteriocin-protection, YdeI or OmpD-Associated/Domain of unknown function (DUF1905)
MIHFKTTLLRPAAPPRATWAFIVLSKANSARLPTRSMIAVQGKLSGRAFAAVLAPDGLGSHWMKVERKLMEAVGAKVGDIVTVEIMPATKEPEPGMPPDLRKALAAAPGAKALWTTLTPVARRDWILWITSAKQPATRVRRISSTCDMLNSGKRRVCCFDRSGIFSKALRAPVAAGPR